jgi:16S rRNA (cytosine1402-N4)-methyltransferase
MYHKPVLLQESVDGLNINPSGIYVDVTFGGGGHSTEILRRLGPKGKLFAFDQDSDAQSNIIDDPRFKFVFGNFRFIRNYLEYYQVEKVDGILADLGVSSHQFDIADRGFSFRLGGKLDMRMNNNQKQTAADILNQAEEERLYYIFKTYCDINNPGQLVKSILNYRLTNKFDDIESFVETISVATPKNREIKYLAQIFQALRIEANDEINSLLEFLDTTPKVLNENGRLSIISYHSLEDRPVKNLIKTGNTKGEQIFDIFGRTNSEFKAINKQIITPSEDELKENPRSKSAKLRIAEKIK